MQVYLGCMYGSTQWEECEALTLSTYTCVFALSLLSWPWSSFRGFLEAGVTLDCAASSAPICLFWGAREHGNSSTTRWQDQALHFHETWTWRCSTASRSCIQCSTRGLEVNDTPPHRHSCRPSDKENSSSKKRKTRRLATFRRAFRTCCLRHVVMQSVISAAERTKKELISYTCLVTYFVRIPPRAFLRPYQYRRQCSPVLVSEYCCVTMYVCVCVCVIGVC